MKKDTRKQQDKYSPVCKEEDCKNPAIENNDGYCMEHICPPPIPLLIQHLNKLEEQKSNNIGIEQIKTTYEKEEYERCLEMVARVLRGEPQNFEVLSYGGACELRLHRYVEAVETFTKCLALNDNGFHVWTFRGDAHYELGEYDKAFSDYWRSLQLEPDNGAVMDKCARSLFRLGNKEFALEYISKAVEKEENVGPVIVMITMLRSMGDIESADRLYQQALLRFPNDRDEIERLLGKI